MNDDVEQMMLFVMEQAEREPLARRVRIYRGLARLCGDAAEQKKLTALAMDLEKADSLCRELNFSFQQKTKDSNKKDGK